MSHSLFTAISDISDAVQLAPLDYLASKSYPHWNGSPSSQFFDTLDLALEAASTDVRIPVPNGMLLLLCRDEKQAQASTFSINVPQE